MENKKKDNIDLIFLALPSWNGDYAKSTIQLVNCLSCNHKILYIDYAYTLKDYLLSFFSIKETRKGRWLKRHALTQEVCSTGNRIYKLMLPPVIPINWISGFKLFLKLNQINSWLVQKRIQWAIDKVGIQEYALVNAFQPFLGLGLVDKLKQKALIYYCYDEIEKARWLGKHGGEVEKKYLQNIDSLVTSSFALAEKKSKFAKSTITITNGVDYNAFNTSQVKNEANSIPTVGYTGSIDERFDTDLMVKVISKLRDLHFVFVGRLVNKEAYHRLKSYPNVNFKEAVAPQQVPEVMKNFDVGIIPYVKNELTQCVYPLKVNEFFAMGLPVVMTPFAELHDLKDKVFLEATADEFGNAIRAAIQYHDEVSRRQNKEFAKRQDWAYKAKQLSEHIDEVVNHKAKAYAFTL